MIMGACYFYRWVSGVCFFYRLAVWCSVRVEGENGLTTISTEVTCLLLYCLPARGRGGFVMYEGRR